MGGNALKHLNPTRLTSMEVLAIYWHVAAMANIAGFEVHLVPWVLDKQDHGDVDILVQEIDEKSDHGRRYLATSLKPVEMKHNGPVVSVGYQFAPGRVAQVDLISVPRHAIRMARLYYAGSGIGMILGRVAAWHGLVLAWDNIRLRSNPELPWSRDIPLTPDPGLALGLLGYDPDAFGAFRTEEDVWEYAMSSPMAQPWMFTSENTNSDNRSRDRGRPGFMRFQEWLKEKMPPLGPHGPYWQRATWEQAVDLARQMDENVDRRIDMQRQEWQHNKDRNFALGMGAVKDQFPYLTDEQAGTVIRDMQETMPPKNVREEMFEDDRTRPLILQMAKLCAWQSARKLGLDQPPKPETT